MQRSVFVWCVMQLLCLVVCTALSLPARSEELNESQASQAAVNAWVKAKGLKNGMNHDANLFVAQSSGRGQLECFLKSLCKFVRYQHEQTVAAAEVMRSDGTKRTS